jgi:hypothetical protein
MTTIELKERRGYNARHYEQDGRRVAEVYYGTVLHYDVDNGGKRTVDMRLTEMENAHFAGLQADKAGYFFLIGRDKDRQQDGWVSVGGKRGQHWLSFRLTDMVYSHRPTGARSHIRSAVYDGKPESSNRTMRLMGGEPVHYATDVSWPGVMQGVDLRWRVEGKGIKEDVVLAKDAFKALPPCPYGDAGDLSFIFELSTVNIPQLTVAGQAVTFDEGFTDAPGAVEILDADSQLVAMLPLDTVTSTGKLGSAAARRRGDVVGQPAARLTKTFYRENGRDYLMVSAALTDLQALPVGDLIFDPSVTLQPDGGTSKDAWNEEKRASTKFGTGDGLHVKTGTGEYGQRNAFIRFDLSSIPSGSVCESAVMTLTNYYNGAGRATISLHPMLFDWSEAQLNWYQYNSGYSWPGSPGGNTPGVDYSTVLLGTFTGPSSNFAKASVNLNAAEVAKWFGASPERPNYGMTMRAADKYNNFYGGEASIVDRRPKLTIVYTEAVVSGNRARAVAYRTGGQALATALTAVQEFDIIRLPPIPITTSGNLFWQTRGPVISAALLMTMGDMWVMSDASDDPQTFTLRVKRTRAYLGPQ